MKELIRRTKGRFARWCHCIPQFLMPWRWTPGNWHAFTTYADKQPGQLFYRPFALSCLCGKVFYVRTGYDATFYVLRQKEIDRMRKGEPIWGIGI